MHSVEPGPAFAAVPVDPVDAPCPIPARVAEAFIDIILACLSGCPRAASALESVDQVLAHAAMLARVALTLVDLRLAEKAAVSRVAIAAE